jgi:hypothetical protein
MLRTRWIALATKLSSPVMVHVTAVPPPAGRKVNSATLVPARGFTKSGSTRISSPGRLSTIVMRPSPTSWLRT